MNKTFKYKVERFCFLLYYPSVSFNSTYVVIMPITVLEPWILRPVYRLIPMTMYEISHSAWLIGPFPRGMLFP